MKWMFYLLLVATVMAHYALCYLNTSRQIEKDKMDFTIEMAKTHPVFVHPIEEK